MRNLSQEKIIILSGHYGCGKTTLSLNVCLELKARGEEVTLADLDIVNPYFCSVEFARPLEKRCIGLIASQYAGTNLDAPALTAQLDGAIASEGRLVIDTGGDDAGATALGRYSRAIASVGYQMLYVVNQKRFLTGTPVKAVELLRQIENAARLRAAGIVNNTNLGVETTVDLVAESMNFAVETARLAGLPLLFTAADARLPGLERLKGPVFPVQTVIRKPWEPPVLQ